MNHPLFGGISEELKRVIRMGVMAVESQGTSARRVIPSRAKSDHLPKFSFRSFPSNFEASPSPYPYSQGHRYYQPQPPREFDHPGRA